MSAETAEQNEETATAITSPSQLSQHEYDIVPESLLALAKDARYVHQCQLLLVQSVESLSQLLGGSYGIKLSPKQSWLLSYAMYVLFVVAPMGRTFGMQATELEFQTTRSGVNLLQRRRFIGSLLLTACLGWVMEYMSDRYGRNEGTRLTSSNSAGQQQQQETLHGRDRRHAYEQLRRQMMARASGGILTQENIASTFPLQSPNLNFPATNTTNVTRSDSIQQRIKNSLSRLCGSLLDAAFISEGPHEVPNLGPTTTTYSVAAWLIRLHLAQYLITGNCPTIFHRMLGLRLKRNSGDSTISARPNLQRLIGVLILAQGSSTFVRNTVNWLATGVARILEQRRQRIQSSQGGSPQRTLDKELAYYFGDAITGDHVEQFDHTGTASTDCPSTDLKSSQIGFMDKQHEQQTNLVCTICRMERLHPAAPVSCGHVCCWNCLMQWVQNVRPECPLCRAPCRPQEIIALHHYEPDTAKESPGIF